MKRHLIAAACALIAGTALAANPTASLDRSFTEYTGAGPIGKNGVDNGSTVYWLYESTGVYSGKSVYSWFVFWDPPGPPGTPEVSGTITFADKILYVHDDQLDLQGTASFGKPGVTYDYSAAAVGLEADDKSGTSFANNTLTLAWRANNPGDHIRVMTAVPEPSAYALSGAALLVVMGFVGRRRRAG